jgi:hypothetical protein
MRRTRECPLLMAVGLKLLRPRESWLESSPAKTCITPFAWLMAVGAAALPDGTSPVVSKPTKTLNASWKGFYSHAIQIGKVRGNEAELRM